MRSYTAREAKNRLGEVLRDAQRGPVVITMHGKPAVRITSFHDVPDETDAPRNTHARLDAIKHRISCVVLATFPLTEIKRRSLANIERWRVNGTYGPAYEEWSRIILDPDDTSMIAAMVGFSDHANQLRQSIPYVGMLDKDVVRKFNEEVAA
jgi:prevent-host-death family protein